MLTEVLFPEALFPEALLPEALRETTRYEVTLGLMQQYIVEEVAGMEKEVIEGQVELSEDHVQRKMVGTVLEAGGYSLCASRRFGCLPLPVRQPAGASISPPAR